MREFPVLLLVLVTSFRCGNSQQAGVKFKLNPNGVGVFNDLGFREVTRINKTLLNNLIGSVEIGDGLTLEYQFTNNYLQNIEYVGVKTTSMISPNYLFVVGRGGYMEVDGDFTLTIKSNGVIQQTISDKYAGVSFNSATGVVFEIDVSDGFITMSDIQCEHFCGMFSVSLDGTKELGFSVDPIEDAMKAHLVQQVCDVFIPKLTSQLNEVFLDTLLYMDLTGPMNGTRVDFSLLPDEIEIVDNNVLLFAVTGKVYPVSNPSVEYPYQIGEFPEFSVTSQMAQMLISDYHLRSLFHSMHDSGQLEFEIPDSSIPRVLGRSVGSLISLLIPGFRPYANMPLTFTARSSEVPTFEVDENSLKINGSFDFALMVQLESGEDFEAMAIDARFTAVGDVISTENAIGINLDDIKFDLELSRSNVGEFPFGIIEASLQGILPTFVKTTMNEILNQGVTIPEFLTMELYNLNATKRKNALEITADLRIN
uniref:Lipopolysaccharide-binding protein n=1 Tax=Phallusia mammillata TaxID=59560 RepID=A0A6F9DK87_9ASCI|nr:lipopolysaccharide-binding protein [Phallusia mammillata]